MTEMIAFCGLECDACPAYLATQEDDDEKRAEVAALWSKMFKADIKPDHINCDGCHTKGGRSFHHCAVCEIRKCGIKRQVANCAFCDDYVCDTLEAFFQMVPDSKTRLDAIRAAR
jgi:hypothetical protein